jgi:hypothetical protein
MGICLQRCAYPRIAVSRLLLERQQEQVMLRASSQLLNNVEHWEARAEEARVQAEQLDGPEVKRMMLDIAESYDKLAKYAAERRSMERARG